MNKERSDDDVESTDDEDGSSHNIPNLIRYDLIHLMKRVYLYLLGDYEH